MAVTLISETERFQCVADGVVFDFRRMNAVKAAEIDAACTEQGVKDQKKAMHMTLEWCVLGWSDQVVNADGEPVRFDASLVKYLPESTKLQIIPNLYATAPEKKAALLKN